MGETTTTGINRIRLEFKGQSRNDTSKSLTVLIESDWNLKKETQLRNMKQTQVLIESDWNLKIVELSPSRLK